MNKETQVEKDTSEDPEKDAQEEGAAETADLDEQTQEIKVTEYQKLQDDLAEQKDKYVRLYAEFDNARKRMEREKQEFVKYANEGLIVEFLNILDDLERTITAAKEEKENRESFIKGVEMVMEQIHKLLKKHGVKPIEAKGKPFDPHCHEILYQEESADAKEGIVLEEFQKGYYLGDRVVRTVKVKVATKSAKGKDKEK